MKTKEDKHDQALERRIDRSRLSDRDQLERLDALLGIDQGAKKERARLKANIKGRKEKR